jgi:hypothetical protein
MTMPPSAPNDEEPVVVLGLDETPAKATATTTVESRGATMRHGGTMVISTTKADNNAWWKDAHAQPRGGRRQGSTALQAAHDMALVAELVRKHGGDAGEAQKHCQGTLGWTDTRWRTISRKVTEIFITAAKEAAVMHAMGVPFTDLTRSTLLAPVRAKIRTMTVRGPTPTVGHQGKAH